IAAAKCARVALAKEAPRQHAKRNAAEQVARQRGSNHAQDDFCRGHILVSSLPQPLGASCDLTSESTCLATSNAAESSIGECRQHVKMLQRLMPAKYLPVSAYYCVVLALYCHHTWVGTGYT